MRDFLSKPVSNVVAVILTAALCGALLLGGSGAGADLAPLALTGSGTTNLDSVALAGNLTVAGTANITGALTEAAGGVTAGEVADVTRLVNLPIYSWYDCTTNGGALIGFDATADALADFVVSNTDGLGGGLAWDDTGGSLDTSNACNTVQVPPDYASGGSIILSIGKDAVTTNAEFINCQGSINGAALGTVGTTAVPTSTIAAYTCTPTLTSLAAGNSLGITIQVTATTAIDDIVTVYSVGFAYTSVQ